MNVYVQNMKYKQCTAHTMPLAHFMYVNTKTFSIGSISTALPKKTAYILNRFNNVCNSIIVELHTFYTSY